MIASANLRSALFDNVQTRPRISSPFRLADGYGIPAFRMPLERSIKPLPTLPHIVGNTRYDPKLFTEGKESPGTAFIRDKLLFRRNVLPTLSGGLSEPSKTNPTVL
jgi:hypothetical protein